MERSSILINLGKTIDEVNKRPKRRLKPLKDCCVEKQNNAPLIIPAVQELIVAKEITASKDECMLTNSGKANDEVNTRPKRCVRPPKLDNYHLDPVVKHKRHPEVEKHNNASQITGEGSSAIQNLTDGVGFNDDVCNLCADAGDLVLCDSCPSAFHKTCLDIQNLPLGQWHCVYCLCKFCGAFQHRRALNSEMMKCSLCEQNFHKCCVKASIIELGSLYFCGRECHEVYENLQRFMGYKIDLEDGFSCTLVKRYDRKHLTSFRRKCNNKVTNASKILMTDCFKRSVDRGTGKNIIKNVTFNKWSKFRRFDYSGFFIALLEKGENLISVATIRIHGNQLAEMPYIGTSTKHRRQGMCRRLLDSIETILCDLGVRELVIPAISEVKPMWTGTYSFTPLEESTKEKMKSMSIVSFPGIEMLQKHVQTEDNIRHKIKGSLI